MNSSRQPFRISRRLVIVSLLVLYFGSYLALSRRGYAEADRYKMKGFYYLTHEDSDAWRFKNYGCVYLFYPLNTIDRCLGTGRPPAAEPLWGLSADIDTSRGREER
jgi:hypothetical protein